MNPNLLAAPIALPLFVAALLLAVSRWGGWRHIELQRWLTAGALVLNLGAALALAQYTLSGHRLVLQMGGWIAPFGITLIADGLTAILLSLTAIVALAVLPFAIATVDLHRERMAFYPLFLVLVLGVNGAFLTGDFFNLYVFFEVLLMASFVLLTVGGQPAQTHAGIRYVVLNLLGSLVFLAAAGIAYGTLGTLNMAHMAERLDSAPMAVRALLAGMLLVAFGGKAALFPLFFWLPSSYHTPPPAVTALFGGLLTKVGVYTLFRSFTLFFPDLLAAWQPLILGIAGATMLVGALGAMAQPTIRRVLSFHIISHVGFMLMGLAVALQGEKLMAGFGLAAAILYMAHHMIVKTGLILAGGAVEIDMGGDRLQSIGGLVSRRPLLALIFFLSAISLAGIPPFSGFISKLSLLQITLDTQHWTVAGVSIVASVLTLINVMRLWREAFWGKYEHEGRLAPHLLEAPVRRWLVMGPIAVLLLLSLGLGLYGERVFQMTTTAAEQALDRAGYIAAVHPVEPESVAGPAEYPAETGGHD
jgi:multicomponent Na+:H+ antiporter subunit D